MTSAPINRTVLKAQGLRKELTGDVPAVLVAGVDLTINVGEFVAIVGASGSGKSSLLYMLGLLDVPTSGKLWVDGLETTFLHEEARANIRLEKMGFVFQSHFLLPEFSALENVLLPMLRLGNVPADVARQQALILLAQLGLEKEVHRFPHQLSGGQSQRVAIARSLANRPPIILADEPTGNLDSKSSKKAQAILRDLAHSHLCAVVVVTHDSEFAEQTDRVLHMCDGLLI